MEFFLFTLFSVAHWLPTALGYNLIFGKGKIIYFATIGTSLIIGYSMFLVVFYTHSFVLGIIIGLLMGCISALFFTLVSLRLDPDGLGVISIALHLAILTVVVNWQSVTRGALGIPGIPRIPLLANTYALYAATIIFAILFYILYSWIDRTTIGRQLSALAESEWQAKSLGIHRAKIYLIAFLLAVLTSLHGNFFFGQYVGFISPSDYHFPSFILVVMAVVAGKPGSVKGVTLATILIIFLREYMRLLPIPTTALGPTRLVIFGFILLVAVWFRRDSLFPPQRKI